jgi:hypothetical protein
MSLPLYLSVPPSPLLPSPVFSSQVVVGSPRPAVSPPLADIDALEEDVVVLDEEDVVVLGEGSASVASRVSSRRVRAPKARGADEGFGVSVHHVESPSLVHLDDPDPVLAVTSVGQGSDGAGSGDHCTWGALPPCVSSWLSYSLSLGFERWGPGPFSSLVGAPRFAVHLCPIFSPFSSGCSFVF